MKKIMSAFILVLVLIFLTHCYSESEVISFPVDKKEIEKSLDQYGIELSIDLGSIVNESQTIYNLLDDDSFVCTVNSNSIGSGRAISFMFSYGEDFEADKKYNFLYSELPKFLNMSETLYGNDSHEILYQLKDFLKSKIAKGRWLYREGNIHGEALIEQVGDDKYFLNSFSVMNAISYEELSQAKSLAWTDTRFNGGEELQIMNVLKFKDYMEAAQDNGYVSNRLMVKGCIADICETDDNIHNMPSGHLTIDNLAIKGKLCDDSGSVDVYLYPNTYSKEELAQERNHYILICDSKPPYAIVCLSPKIAGGNR